MWVQTKADGWVNLAFVASATHVHAGVALRGAGGRIMGILADHFDLEECIQSEIVPATAGQEAIVVRKWPGDKGPEIEFHKVAIVAWKVSKIASFPIIAGDAPASNETILIVQPDGRLCNPLIEEWDDLETAKRALIAEAKMQTGET